MLLGVDLRGHIAAFEARPDNAAHSMDTDWYAVDRHGHVAQLSSGEEGAVPWEAHRQYWAELYEDLAIARIEVLLAAAPVEGRQILALGDPAPRPRTLSPHELPFLWNGVLRFSDRAYLELFRDEHYPAGWRVIDAHTVAVTDVPRPGFLDYWDAGAISRAYVTGRQLSPRSIGLFEYACSFSGPYRRTAVPADPMLVEDLPEPLRGKLGALEISKLSFNVATELDPEPMFRCHTYR
jgi:hypothetical protein